MTYDFEEIIKGLKDDARKQNTEVLKALSSLQEKVETKNETQPGVSPKVTSPPTSSLPPSAVASPPKKSSSHPEPKKPGKGRSKTNSKRKTYYQRKSRVLYVGDSLAHNANVREVEVVTNTTIKTAKAYSSAWDASARFKDKNVTDVVKNEMKSGTFNHIVLAAPTVDISNLDTTKVKPSDNTEAFKQKIATSCKNMIKVAERALAEQPDLEKVTIMNHAPRYDASLHTPLAPRQSIMKAKRGRTALP